MGNITNITAQKLNPAALNGDEKNTTPKKTKKTDNPIEEFVKNYHNLKQKISNKTVTQKDFSLYDTKAAQLYFSGEAFNKLPGSANTAHEFNTEILLLKNKFILQQNISAKKTVKNLDTPKQEFQYYNSKGNRLLTLAKKALAEGNIKKAKSYIQPLTELNNCMASKTGLIDYAVFEELFGSRAKEAIQILQNNGLIIYYKHEKQAQVTNAHKSESTIYKAQNAYNKLIAAKLHISFPELSNLLDHAPVHKSDLSNAASYFFVETLILQVRIAYKNEKPIEKGLKSIFNQTLETLYNEEKNPNIPLESMLLDAEQKNSLKKQLAALYYEMKQQGEDVSVHKYIEKEFQSYEQIKAIMKSLKQDKLSKTDRDQLIQKLIKLAKVEFSEKAEPAFKIELATTLFHEITDALKADQSNMNYQQALREYYAFIQNFETKSPLLKIQKTKLDSQVSVFTNKKRDIVKRDGFTFIEKAIKNMPEINPEDTASSDKKVKKDKIKEIFGNQSDKVIETLFKNEFSFFSSTETLKSDFTADEIGILLKQAGISDDTQISKLVDHLKKEKLLIINPSETDYLTNIKVNALIKSFQSLLDYYKNLGDRGENIFPALLKIVKGKILNKEEKQTLFAEFYTNKTQNFQGFDIILFKIRKIFLDLKKLGVENIYTANLKDLINSYDETLAQSGNLSEIKSLEVLKNLSTLNISTKRKRAILQIIHDKSKPLEGKVDFINKSMYIFACQQLIHSYVSAEDPKYIDIIKEMTKNSPAELLDFLSSIVYGNNINTAIEHGYIDKTIELRAQTAFRNPFYKDQLTNWSKLIKTYFADKYNKNSQLKDYLDKFPAFGIHTASAVNKIGLISAILEATGMLGDLVSQIEKDRKMQGAGIIDSPFTTNFTPEVLKQWNLLLQAIEIESILRKNNSHQSVFTKKGKINHEILKRNLGKSKLFIKASQLYAKIERINDPKVILKSANLKPFLKAGVNTDSGKRKILVSEITKTALTQIAQEGNKANKVAKHLIDKIKSEGIKVNKKNILETVQYFVIDAISFINDEKSAWELPENVLTSGKGDCEDIALLQYALSVYIMSEFSKTKGFEALATQISDLNIMIDVDSRDISSGYHVHLIDIDSSSKEITAYEGSYNPAKTNRADSINEFIQATKKQINNSSWLAVIGLNSYKNKNKDMDIRINGTTHPLSQMLREKCLDIDILTGSILNPRNFTTMTGATQIIADEHKFPLPKPGITGPYQNEYKLSTSNVGGLFNENYIVNNLITSEGEANNAKDGSNSNVKAIITDVYGTTLGTAYYQSAAGDVTKLETGVTVLNLEPETNEKNTFTRETNSAKKYQTIKETTIYAGSGNDLVSVTTVNSNTGETKTVETDTQYNSIKFNSQNTTLLFQGIQISDTTETNITKIGIRETNTGIDININLASGHIVSTYISNEVLNVTDKIAITDISDVSGNFTTNMKFTSTASIGNRTVNFTQTITDPLEGAKTITNITETGTLKINPDQPTSNGEAPTGYSLNVISNSITPATTLQETGETKTYQNVYWEGIINNTTTTTLNHNTAKGTITGTIKNTKIGHTTLAENEIKTETFQLGNYIVHTEKTSVSTQNSSNITETNLNIYNSITGTTTVINGITSDTSFNLTSDGGITINRENSNESILNNNIKIETYNYHTSLTTSTTIDRMNASNTEFTTIKIQEESNTTNGRKQTIDFTSDYLTDGENTHTVSLLVTDSYEKAGIKTITTNSTLKNPFNNAITTTKSTGTETFSLNVENNSLTIKGPLTDTITTNGSELYIYNIETNGSTTIKLNKNMADGATSSHTDIDFNISLNGTRTTTTIKTKKNVDDENSLEERIEITDNGNGTKKIDTKGKTEKYDSFTGTLSVTKNSSNRNSTFSFNNTSVNITNNTTNTINFDGKTIDIYNEKGTKKTSINVDHLTANGQLNKTINITIDETSNGTQTTTLSTFDKNKKGELTHEATTTITDSGTTKKIITKDENGTITNDYLGTVTVTISDTTGGETIEYNTKKITIDNQSDQTVTFDGKYIKIFNYKTDLTQTITTDKLTPNGQVISKVTIKDKQTDKGNETVNIYVNDVEQAAIQTHIGKTYGTVTGKKEGNSTKTNVSIIKNNLMGLFEITTGKETTTYEINYNNTSTIVETDGNQKISFNGTELKTYNTEGTKTTVIDIKKLGLAGLAIKHINIYTEYNSKGIATTTYEIYKKSENDVMSLDSKITVIDEGDSTSIQSSKSETILEDVYLRSISLNINNSIRTSTTHFNQSTITVQNDNLQTITVNKDEITGYNQESNSEILILTNNFKSEGNLLALVHVTDKNNSKGEITVTVSSKDESNGTIATHSATIDTTDNGITTGSNTTEKIEGRQNLLEGQISVTLGTSKENYSIEYANSSVEIQTDGDCEINYNGHEVKITDKTSAEVTIIDLNTLTNRGLKIGTIRVEKDSQGLSRVVVDSTLEKAVKNDVQTMDGITKTVSVYLETGKDTTITNATIIDPKTKSITVLEGINVSNSTLVFHEEGLEFVKNADTSSISLEKTTKASTGISIERLFIAYNDLTFEGGNRVGSSVNVTNMFTSGEVIINKLDWAEVKDDNRNVASLKVSNSKNWTLGNTAIILKFTIDNPFEGSNTVFTQKTNDNSQGFSDSTTKKTVINDVEYVEGQTKSTFNQTNNPNITSYYCTKTVVNQERLQNNKLVQSQSTSLQKQTIINKNSDSVVYINDSVTPVDIKEDSNGVLRPTEYRKDVNEAKLTKETQVTNDTAEGTQSEINKSRKETTTSSSSQKGQTEKISSSGAIITTEATEQEQSIDNQSGLISVSTKTIFESQNTVRTEGPNGVYLQIIETLKNPAKYITTEQGNLDGLTITVKNEKGEDVVLPLAEIYTTTKTKNEKGEDVVKWQSISNIISTKIQESPEIRNLLITGKSRNGYEQLGYGVSKITKGDVIITSKSFMSGILGEDTVHKITSYFSSSEAKSKTNTLKWTISPNGAVQASQTFSDINTISTNTDGSVNVNNFGDTDSTGFNSTLNLYTTQQTHSDTVYLTNDINMNITVDNQETYLIGKKSIDEGKIIIYPDKFIIHHIDGTVQEVKSKMFANASSEQVIKFTANYINQKYTFLAGNKSGDTIKKNQFAVFIAEGTHKKLSGSIELAYKNLNELTNVEFEEMGTTSEELSNLIVKTNQGINERTTTSSGKKSQSTIILNTNKREHRQAKVKLVYNEKTYAVEGVIKLDSEGYTSAGQELSGHVGLILKDVATGVLEIKAIGLTDINTNEKPFTKFDQVVSWFTAPTKDVFIGVNAFYGIEEEKLIDSKTRSKGFSLKASAKPTSYTNIFAEIAHISSSGNTQNIKNKSELWSLNVGGTAILSLRELTTKIFGDKVDTMFQKEFGFSLKELSLETSQGKEDEVIKKFIDNYNANLEIYQARLDNQILSFKNQGIIFENIEDTIYDKIKLYSILESIFDLKDNMKDSLHLNFGIKSDFSKNLFGGKIEISANAQVDILEGGNILSAMAIHTQQISDNTNLNIEAAANPTGVFGSIFFGFKSKLTKKLLKLMLPAFIENQISLKNIEILAGSEAGLTIPSKDESSSITLAYSALEGLKIVIDQTHAGGTATYYRIPLSITDLPGFIYDTLFNTNKVKHEGKFIDLPDGSKLARNENGLYTVFVANPTNKEVSTAKKLTEVISALASKKTAVFFNKTNTKLFFDKNKNQEKDILARYLKLIYETHESGGVTKEVPLNTLNSIFLSRKQTNFIGDTFSISYKSIAKAKAYLELLETPGCILKSDFKDATWLTLIKNKAIIVDKAFPDIALISEKKLKSTKKQLMSELGLSELEATTLKAKATYINKQDFPKKWEIMIKNKLIKIDPNNPDIGIVQGRMINNLHSRTLNLSNDQIILIKRPGLKRSTIDTKLTNLLTTDIRNAYKNAQINRATNSQIENKEIVTLLEEKTQESPKENTKLLTNLNLTLSKTLEMGVEIVLSETQLLKISQSTKLIQAFNEMLKYYQALSTRFKEGTYLVLEITEEKNYNWLSSSLDVNEYTIQIPFSSLNKIAKYPKPKIPKAYIADAKKIDHKFLDNNGKPLPVDYVNNMLSTGAKPGINILSSLGINLQTKGIQGDLISTQLHNFNELYIQLTGKINKHYLLELLAFNQNATKTVWQALVKLNIITKSGQINKNVLLKDQLSALSVELAKDKSLIELTSLHPMVKEAIEKLARIYTYSRKITCNIANHNQEPININFKQLKNLNKTLGYLLNEPRETMVFLNHIILDPKANKSIDGENGILTINPSALSNNLMEQKAMLFFGDNIVDASIQDLTMKPLKAIEDAVKLFMTLDKNLIASLFTNFKDRIKIDYKLADTQLTPKSFEDYPVTINGYTDMEELNRAITKYTITALLPFIGENTDYGFIDKGIIWLTEKQFLKLKKDIKELDPKIAGEFESSWSPFGNHYIIADQFLQKLDLTINEHKEIEKILRANQNTNLKINVQRNSEDENSYDLEEMKTLQRDQFWSAFFYGLRKVLEGHKQNGQTIASILQHPAILKALTFMIDANPDKLEQLIKEAQ